MRSGRWCRGGRPGRALEAGAENRQGRGPGRCRGAAARGFRVRRAARGLEPRAEATFGGDRAFTVLWATHLGRSGGERGSKPAQPAAGGGRGRGRKKSSKAAVGPAANEPDVLFLAEQLPRTDVVRLPLWRFGQPPTGARRAAAAFTRDFTATGAQPSLVVPAASTSMALHLQAAVGAPALPPPGPARGKGPTTEAAPQERAMPG